MSIVCAAVKGGEVAIAADTQSNCGGLTISASYLHDCQKIVSVNGSYMGMVGWTAVSKVFEHLARTRPELFQFEDRHRIFSTLLALQNVLKEDCYIESREDNNQPVESNQLEALIINSNGLFGVGSYREVRQYRRYWAIGSGQLPALGAMHALWTTGATATELVTAGISAAAEFDDSCGLPLRHFTIPCDEFSGDGAPPGSSAECVEADPVANTRSETTSAPRETGSSSVEPIRAPYC